MLNERGLFYFTLPRALVILPMIGGYCTLVTKVKLNTYQLGEAFPKVSTHMVM